MGNLPGAQSLLLDIYVEEVADQRRDVFPALAQRRDIQLKHRQPEIQILAKGALSERFHQIFIRRRNDPHVHLDRLRPTQSLEPLLLQHSEHLGLGRQAHIADFIQKQRAAVRHLKLSAPHHHCTGERSLFVAEQFALNERLGDRSAVHLNEWTVGARALNMDRPGH